MHLFAEVHNPGSHESLVTPRGYHALIIVYKKAEQNDFIHIDFAPGISAPRPQHDGIFLIGHYTRSFKAYSSGTFSILYTVFEPAGTVAFFGHHQHHFTNACIPVDELGLRIPVEKVREDLSLALTYSRRVQIIEEVLTTLIKNNRNNPLTKFGEVAYWIMQMKGNLSVQKIADECGMSKRTLERKFTQIHGVSPKQYLKIVRFRSVVHYLQSQTTIEDWHSLLHRANYFDQSHFIRDFQEFTGKSPSAFLRMDRDFDNSFVKVLQ